VILAFSDSRRAGLGDLLDVPGRQPSAGALDFESGISRRHHGIFPSVCSPGFFDQADSKNPDAAGFPAAITLRITNTCRGGRSGLSPARQLRPCLRNSL
jgi:hypothetical protein